MNKTVELLNHWAEFEGKNPKASLEDFCSAYLLQNREQSNNSKLFGGQMIPPSPDLVLLKLMGRIMKISSVYMDSAMKDTGAKRLEEFYFLNYIFQMKDPRKTEVIYCNIQELSTGLAILDDLIKMGYVKEKEDVQDKRSKRLSITPKGEKVLFACYEQFAKVGNILLQDIPVDDIQLCIKLLQPIDDKFSTLWQKDKGKPFEDICKNFPGNMCKLMQAVFKKKGK